MLLRVQRSVNLERLEEQRSLRKRDYLVLRHRRRHRHRPHRSACDREPAGVFRKTQTALDSTCLRPGQVARHIADTWIVIPLDDDLVVRTEPTEVRVDGI